ncbi:cache domain-containing protein [Nostoc sphaeroides]|uniref:Mcp, methyl-accepting chemotaxis protein n=1 Tax=Nostoc sphaeroides CCNUC1 TaxID=2653204 RepID=A0A5P8VWH5_9NOSO|nr:cache domain-containing protein [Nostoc sphaeroides]QFS44765.1 mcp, methyl-accepting chemotaxis protein [Nostoc sphaeroides CCNUC1]
MQLRFKVPFLVTLVVLITSVFLALSSYQSAYKSIGAAGKQELQTTANLIQNSIQEQSTKALARADLISRLPPIQQAFRTNNRNQLLDTILPSFKVQKERFGITEGQFHLAPATSYLRVFAPDAPQEDLSSFREMVVMTNRDYEPRSGVEIGRRGLGIRGVVPISDAQGPIGSFEVALDFKPILEALKKVNDFEGGVFVDEVLMSTIATLTPKPDPEKIIGGLRNQDSTNWQVIRSLVSPDLLTKANDVTLKIENIDGMDYGIALVPLLDFKGKKIGVIVAGRDFQSLTSQARGVLVNNIVLAILQVIVLTGTVWVLFNGLLMRPILALGNLIANTVRDDVFITVDDLSARRDEVGQIAKSFELLQKRFTDMKKELGLLRNNA